LKTLSPVLAIEEFESKNKTVKFALRILPFQQKNFAVIIDYFNKIDFIRVTGSIGIAKNLKGVYKTKNDLEKNEIVALFSKPMTARNFSPIFDKDFGFIEGFKLLIQQNMSAQMLLDAVTEAIFLLQDLGILLYEADQSLKVPKISETSKSMFQ